MSFGSRLDASGDEYYSRELFEERDRVAFASSWRDRAEGRFEILAIVKL